MSAEAAQPILRPLLEAVAAVMELDEGEHRLELVFTDGNLRRWRTESGPRGTDALAAFDDRARYLHDVLEPGGES
jgi:hypothetical protein